MFVISNITQASTPINLFILFLDGHAANAARHDEWINFYLCNKAYYNWYIETPQFHGINVTSFAARLDQALIEHSAGYAKGRKRKSLDMPKVQLLKPGAFLEYLKTRNSSSLQLKVPKVSNSREIAEFLITNRLLIDN